MELATAAVADRNGIRVVHESYPELDQRDRIIEALGSVIPKVHEESLARYYTYLAAKLSFPFTAYFPEPTNTLEEVLHRCVVVELLDPAERLDDGVGGIFCNIHKGIYEITLPLIELEIPHDSPNFQFIDDYWYWFWNWR